MKTSSPSRTYGTVARIVATATLDRVHEATKIREAEYFLGQMLCTQNQLQHFTYNLSAFLSAARSVLQYALAEAKTKPNGQA